MSTTLTATEQRILNAAKTIFYQKGLSGARTHEIAHKAGLNKAMLHYYFRSKERLYQSVLNDSIEQFLPIITNILGHRKLTLQEKIETVIDRYFKLLEEEPKVAYFVINAFNQRENFL